MTDLFGSGHHAGGWSRALRWAEAGLGRGILPCAWCGRQTGGAAATHPAASAKRVQFPASPGSSALSATLRNVFGRRFLHLAADDSAPIIPALPTLCAGCRGQIPWISAIRCTACGRGEPCEDCSRRERAVLLANRAAVRYTPFMKELLARYKYRGSERLSPLFGQMAGYAFAQLQTLWDGSSSDRNRRPKRAAPAPVALTYVPLSERRLEERGFNQAEAMAAGIGQQFRLPVVPLLQRQRHTEKMSYKTRRERLTSLDNAFAVRPDGMERLSRLFPSAPPPPIHVVIVDDVYTTGSTMHRCAEIIDAWHEPDAVRLYGLTWAR